MQQLAASAPIGLFDSGVGGLSIYLHLYKQLPNERYIYYADTQHVPYGSRDSQQICDLTLMAVDWLYQQGCKLIVIACNSASAHGLEAARQRYPHIPIVGLVPALKPAVLASQSKHVVVLATQATLNGRLLNQVIDDIATPTGTQVSKYFDPLLVPWVEAGMPLTALAADNLKQQVAQFAAQGADHIVLGCTHYPFFRSYLEQQIQHLQRDIQVVDSGQAIAARVRQLLTEQKLLAPHITQRHAQYSTPINPAISSRCCKSDKNQHQYADDKQSDEGQPPLLFFASQSHPTLAPLVTDLLKQPVAMYSKE